MAKSQTLARFYCILLGLFIDVTPREPHFKETQEHHKRHWRVPFQPPVLLSKPIERIVSITLAIWQSVKVRAKIAKQVG
jgi:hypothetical protein